MSANDGWLWLTLGSAGAAFALALHCHSRLLASPLHGHSLPRTTPRGAFGAHRAGPPVHSHQGLDLIARAGSAVLAVGSGTIIATNPGLGKVVRKLELDSPGRWSGAGEFVDAIVYADLGAPTCDVGDHLRKGDVIAQVAPAGFVHFAVKQRLDGREMFVDPAFAGFAYLDSSTEEA